MQPVFSAFSRALGQLGDPAIIAVLAKSIAVTLLLFVLGGAGLGYAASHFMVSHGIALSAEAGALVAIVAMIGGGWLLFRLVALAVIQFFADEIVVAVERRHYPQTLGTARKLRLGEELRHSLRGIGRVLLVNAAALLVAIPLVFTAIGPAIIFGLANSWLLGRELQDIVWLRHTVPGDTAPPPLGKLQRLVLGGVVTGLLTIPFVNLLAPVIGAASAVHLVHSAAAKRAMR